MPVFGDNNLAQGLSGFLLICITEFGFLCLKNLALFLCDEQPLYFCDSLTMSPYKVIDSIKHSASLLIIVRKHNCTISDF